MISLPSDFVFLCSNLLLHLFLCLIHFLSVLLHSLSLSLSLTHRSIQWRALAGDHRTAASVFTDWSRSRQQPTGQLSLFKRFPLDPITSFKLLRSFLSERDLRQTLSLFNGTWPSRHEGNAGSIPPQVEDRNSSSDPNGAQQRGWTMMNQAWGCRALLGTKHTAPDREKTLFAYELY